MVYFLKNFFKSVNEICSHGYLLLVGLLIMVVLFCLLPALLQLLIIIFVAFCK